MVVMIEALRHAGLTGNEAKVYVELLQRGRSSAHDLAKAIGMDRTLAYTVLQHLIEKGMVSYVVQDKKKQFVAARPDNLLNAVKKQQAYISDLLPELHKIEKRTEAACEVTTYEGKDGIRTFIRELGRTKSFCSFGATGKLFDALYEMPHIVNDFVAQGIHGKIVLSNTYRTHAITNLSNLQFRYLDVTSEATTTIFDDVVAIHLIQKKATLLLIRNVEIAASYRAYFGILWQCAYQK